MSEWKKLKPLYKGMILIILSAFFFALMNMFVHLSGELPSVQKSFFRNLMAFIFAGVILLKDKNKTKITKDAYIPLLLRSAFGTVGILCNFYALDRLDLADASILNKMSPFFAIIFSIFILKEKIKPLQLMIVFGALAGAMFVVKPSFSNTQTVPALIALTGGMCAGFAYTMVRVMGIKGVKGAVIVCFFSGFSCLVTAPILIFDYTPMSAEQLIILILAGLSAAGGQFTITSAYCYAPAKDVSVYDYSQIIFAAALGFMVFGQIPDLLSWIGYFIIVAMAVLMFVYNKNASNKQQADES
ncbi:MAG: DMT family transporter [Clostridia bacterium]|nr:DMT family transporter [Clostridia bacterium]